MNTETIARLTQRIKDEQYQGFHSLAILRNGFLVHEAYFDGYNRDSLHPIASITKGITALLIGLAMDQGAIPDVDASVVSLLPEYAGIVKDDRLRAVTLRHVLTLTTGLDWDESNYSYCDPRNGEYHQVRSKDWVRYVLERPMRDEPGSVYAYNTGMVHVLSAVIQSRTGMPTAEFARTRLLLPLGITEFDWNKDPLGYPCTGGTHGGMRLRTRDLLRLGQMMLEKGKWQGKQIVPSEWVAECTRTHLKPRPQFGIGYLWRTASMVIHGRRIDYYYGAGYGGQTLAIVPELALVFAMTSRMSERDADILPVTLMVLNAAING